ncbi:hypothetical protein VNO77_43224 [Canavalia gladiata]|uniref:Uncharacterized protein n=1 Tax=Canavalia gladiata TaxID=3824 RepID=A0AAN9JTU1_CANGL
MNDVDNKLAIHIEEEASFQPLPKMQNKQVCSYIIFFHRIDVVPIACILLGLFFFFGGGRDIDRIVKIPEVSFMV